MREWVRKNLEAFERDVFRDFCLASVSLEEQIRRFMENGTVSFSVMQSLVGVPLKKGVLWRIKDKAHHVFPESGKDAPAGPLLDWTLGYLFHESLKLVEDAYQHQYYTPHESGSTSRARVLLPADLMDELAAVRNQTRESMRREVACIAKLLSLTRRLFTLYFAGRADQKPLARFLNDDAALVRQVFQDEHEALMASIYGSEPERMSVQAARSLLESARLDAASRSVADALACNPACREALELRKDLLCAESRAVNGMARVT